MSSIDGKKRQQSAQVFIIPMNGTFKQAQKVGKQAEAEQAELGFG
jgi:hypothetical protein